ncbi:MAG: hypothetical protein KC442_16500 [Thermomicrobiales bacterium]|nr:hypothetical protein [Thermomicrobiales bacterium]
MNTTHGHASGNDVAEGTSRPSRRHVLASFGAIALGALGTAAASGSTLAALEPALGAEQKDLTNNTRHTKHTRHTHHTGHGSRRRHRRRRNRRRR